MEGSEDRKDQAILRLLRTKKGVGTTKGLGNCSCRLARHATARMPRPLTSPLPVGERQAAASVSRRSASEFVLESALAKADEALADHWTFGLNADQWQAFLSALDAPTRPLPRMQRLLKESGFFYTTESRSTLRKTQFLLWRVWKCSHQMTRLHGNNPEDIATDVNRLLGYPVRYASIHLDTPAERLAPVWERLKSRTTDFP